MLFSVYDSIKQEVEQLFEKNYENNIQLAIAIKQHIRNNNDDLVNYLINNTDDIETVVKYKVYCIDLVLQNIWAHFFKDNNDLCLAAVGGYGRRELMPHSDIDLVILYEENTQDTHAETLSGFITFLWDTGLDIGSTVRSIEECRQEAEKDITVITNLMEGFYIAGKKDLFKQMETALAVDKMWDKKQFFEAKLEEKNIRYEKFNDASYKLEPNLKESPGGLRDIHNIIWVLKRAFNVNDLNRMKRIGFIQEDECNALIEGRNFLWLIRFLLHGFAKRQENRVLFNYQQTLSDVLGYQGERLNDRIEQLMQRYFKTITELSRINELLMQLFKEEILFKNQKQEIVRINNRFQVRNGYLETQSEELFKLFPPAILETFVILSTHQEIIGVRAETIRQIRNNLDEINEEFRSDSICKTLFINIFRYPDGLTHQLRRMARYGVLSRYIPAFENVVGRMQYDLFHVYSVDQHTLMLVRNLRRFAIEEHNHEFPDCSAIMKKLPKNEVLFLAGLFHDIAKGRKGDHAKLGAIEAKDFAIKHNMSSVDTKLLSWLVASHLIMSTTAQHKDLTDPEVIHEFAIRVGSVNYLRQLYLLTICDMRATNPQAWSDWKYQLLSDLYNKTLNLLRRGLDNPIDIDETVLEKKLSCTKQLALEDCDLGQINDLWDSFRKGYFIRYHEFDIIVHTRAIINHQSNAPLVHIYNDDIKQCSNVFIYTQNTDRLFSIICNALERMDINILESRIIISKDNKSLFNFSIIDNNLKAISDGHVMDKIHTAIYNAIKNNEKPKPHHRKTQYHTHQHFDPYIRLIFSTWKDLTVLHISATDAPGILSLITQVLYDHKIRVHNAKIGIIGEKIDDVLFISNFDDKQLKEDELKQLHSELTAQITNLYQTISND